MVNRIKNRKTYSFKFGLIISFSLLLCGGCEQISRSFKETFEEDKDVLERKSALKGTAGGDTIPYGENSLFADQQKLRAIQQELLHLPEFKNREIQVYEHIVFFDFKGGHIDLKIQDPLNPENFDEYDYRSQSGWQKGKPVKTGKHSSVDNATIPLESIDFGVVYKIQRTVLEKSKAIEGAERNTFIYFYNFSHSGKKEWQTQIVGARKDYILDFNIEGDLIDMKEM